MIGRLRFLLLGLYLAAVPSAHAQPASMTKALESARSGALSTKKRTAIDRYVAAEMRRQRIPGVAIGVYRAGHQIYAKGFGQADVEWQVPMTSDTRMQTGSLGKQFVATAILRLAEQGKVDIDASIRIYFPEAPQALQPVTVAHLLSHTSGLGAYDEPDMVKPGGAFDLRRDFTEDQLAKAITALPTTFAPGGEWQYNNGNYVLLGILIHRVTGQFYGDYLRTAFFAPLGMQSTRIISDTDIIARRASGYEIKGGVLQNQAWVSPTFNATADGTIYTTVADMARWDRALSGNDLLKGASFKRMYTPFVLADGKPNASGYGFGWMMRTTNGHRQISHNGAWQGFSSAMIRFPDDNLSVVVFVNLDSGHARPDLIGRVVAGLVLPALMPAKATALPDAPDRFRKIRAFLSRTLAGEDMTNEFVPGSPYKRDLADIAELTAALPQGWQTAPMVLVRQQSQGAGGRYSYRVGPVGNTVLLTIALSPSGRVAGYGIAPDPDNR